VNSNIKRSAVLESVFSALAFDKSSTDAENSQQFEYNIMSSLYV